MKLVLVFLVTFFAVSQAGEFKCPHPYVGQLKHVNLKLGFGVWYLIRTSPLDEYKNAECVTQTIWRTNDTPENTVNTLWASQTNETWQYVDGTATVKPTGVDGQVEPIWEWKFGNATVNSVFVESDHGQHWGIYHLCHEHQDGELTSIWGIVSRSKKMDPKLEQILVEKVEKYSGVTRDNLRGIRQTGCYDLNRKDWY